FLEISLQRNFQGLLSIVQLSRFLSFFLFDSFDILSNLFRFVKNFFIFLFCPFRFPLGQLQATACIDYHISRTLSTTFFHLFFRPFQSLISAPSPPVIPPPRLRSWSFSCGREFLSSATGAILPLLELIVNVFSIFYLFQTIHTIPTFFFHYLSFMPVTLLSQILTLISLFTLSLDIQYSSIYRKNHLLILPVVLCHT
ncbi:hypothetical protein, partial [Mediterraneibacter glycyrrhizinilyticus]|uniref:hypothetical protein n=1 Tax=Mediterraneibacter glycyrrhizinilyticus TaxID=342942 RepID=UPI0019618912